MAQQMLSYFIPQQVRPYGLSGNAGFSFHWINSPSCLLFCSVLTYSFIHNGMCIVVSGCLVIVIQLETEHILNKRKLIRLILFPFFFSSTPLSPHPVVKYEQKMTLRCTISWLLSWHHVSNNNGITLKIMELSHLLPLQSPLVDDQPCCSNCTSGCVDFPLIFTFPLLNPLIRQSCNILTVVVPVGSNLDVVFSNNVCTSVCFSWCPCVIMQSEVSQPAEKTESAAISFFIHSLLSHNQRWPTAENEKPWSVAHTFFHTHIPMQHLQ